MNPQLDVAIAGDVDGLAGDRLIRAQRALGFRKVAPYLRAQERQVQAAEDAVPVCVVALSAPDGATRGGRISPPPAQGRPGNRRKGYMAALAMSNRGEGISKSD